jgi:hypothetical protein
LAFGLLNMTSMRGSTLAKPPGTAPVYAQQGELPADVGISGRLAAEAPPDRLHASRGIVVGIALGAGLWAVIARFLPFLRH